MLSGHRYAVAKVFTYRSMGIREQETRISYLDGKVWDTLFIEYSCTQ